MYFQLSNLLNIVNKQETSFPMLFLQIPTLMTDSNQGPLSFTTPGILFFSHYQVLFLKGMFCQPLVLLETFLLVFSHRPQHLAISLQLVPLHLQALSKPLLWHLEFPCQANQGTFQVVPFHLQAPKKALL